MKKKMLITACAGAGGSFIGSFANDLDTVIGCTFFGLGVIMVAGSLIVYIIVLLKDIEIY